MALIEWGESFATGNELVDSQHQSLFLRFNEIHEDILLGEGRERLLPKLEELGVQVFQHFMTEEYLMIVECYPQLERHRRKHLRLLSSGMDVLRNFRLGKLALTSKLIPFMSEWMHQHVQEEDMELVNWMKQKQIAMAGVAGTESNEQAAADAVKKFFASASFSRASLNAHCLVTQL